MSVNEIHVGDKGTLFTFTVKDGSSTIDISAATVTGNLILSKPGGTISTLSAGFVTAGTDGAIIYTSTATDFGETGTHKFQVIVDDGTNKWNTDVFVFKVHPNLT